MDARLCMILVLVGALRHSYFVVLTVDCERGMCNNTEPDRENPFDEDD